MFIGVSMDAYTCSIMMKGLKSSTSSAGMKDDLDRILKPQRYGDGNFSGLKKVEKGWRRLVKSYERCV